MRSFIVPSATVFRLASLMLFCSSLTVGCRSGAGGDINARLHQARSPFDVSTNSPATSLAESDVDDSDIVPVNAEVADDASPFAAEVGTDAAISRDGWRSSTEEAGKDDANLFAQAADIPTTPPERFRIPSLLPGSEAPPLRLPPLDPSLPLERRREEIEKLYRPLPAIEPAATLPLGSHGQPYSLADLQQLAIENSPTIRQAAAHVESRRGAALQAGLYPNPEVGYQSDTVNTAGTNGYHGGFVAQTFVTANKLGIAVDAECVAVRSAELELRRARIELATDVRRNFYAVLVARERLRYVTALATLSDEIHRAQIERVVAGEAAPYEPLQLRVLAVQARNNMVRAENAERAAWKRLASAVAVTDLPRTQLAGDVEVVLPAISAMAAEAWLLQNHTDLAVAYNGWIRSRHLLDLARVKPIPNIDVTSAIQKDYTGPPFGTTYNLQVGIPLPLFDRNTGNIHAAEADTVSTSQEQARVRNRLLAELADALAEYDSARRLAGNYRGDVLGDQVRTYRSMYARFQQDREGVAFGDLVIAQQTLATAISAYVDILGSEWDAAVTLAELLQLDDLFDLQRIAGEADMPTAPAPEEPMKLPVPQFPVPAPAALPDAALTVPVAAPVAVADDSEDDAIEPAKFEMPLRFPK